MYRSIFQSRLLNVIYRGPACSNQNCPICLTKIVFKVEFGCTHCVCSDCVENYKQYFTTSEKIPCPLCRQITEISGTKTNNKHNVVTVPQRLQFYPSSQFDAPRSRLDTTNFVKSPILSDIQDGRRKFEAQLWMEDGTTKTVMIVCAKSRNGYNVITNIIDYSKRSLFGPHDMLKSKNIFLVCRNLNAIEENSAWKIINDNDARIFPDCSPRFEVHMEVTRQI